MRGTQPAPVFLTAALGRCLYAFMRTTIMFAPQLMRAAKAKSAERGESLKALLTRAVEAELGRNAPAASARARVTLPMFGSADARRSAHRHSG